MKTKNLLMAVALPLAFTACSQDELVSDNSEFNGVATLSNVKLVASKAETTATKGLFEQNGKDFEFKWNLPGEDLGVCWTGKSGDVVYIDQSQKNLFTNYEFTGDQGADNLNTDGTLKSPSGSGKFKYASFKTTASSLFEGEYVVYSPYNASFNKAGKIKATQENTVDLTSKADLAAQLAKVGPQMFLMSGRTAMNGGQTVSKFELSTKSAVLDLKISKDNAEASPITIDKVILYDPTGLASEMYFDADGNKVDVKYGHKTITATYSTVPALDLDKNTPKDFIIPLLAENLKASTKIYLHSQEADKWAILPFTKEFPLKNGITPLTIKGLKVADFKHSLVVDATELETAVTANVSSIDLLTDITVTANFASYNTGNAVNIISSTGAKLTFDVATSSLTFGAASQAINFDLDVVVKNSKKNSNTFTLACPSTIKGNFENNVENTFNLDVTIAESAKLTNNAKLNLTPGQKLNILGSFTNSKNGELQIPNTAACNVNGRNSVVLNEGKIVNEGVLAITKYNTNSVVNNGVAVVGVQGQFEGDFDLTSTGSFWKKVNTLDAFKEALGKSYSKVVVSTSLDFTSTTKPVVFEAGNKDLDFMAAPTLPSTSSHKNVTLNTTGKLTVSTNALTIGNPSASKAVVTFNVGSVLVKNVGLTVDKGGVLNVAGDIEASGAAAVVTFKKDAIVTFVNYTNLNGASLTLDSGAKVTYTGRINL